MARSLRFGRVGSAFAVVALVLTSLVAPASPVVAKTRLAPATSQNPQLERSEVMRGVPSVQATPVFPKASAQRGTPSIELNVDGPDDGQLSLFTFGTDIVVKIAFGNRFTIPAGQAPFTLKQIAAVFASGDDGGFEAGETAGITVMGDPAGSGNIANSVVLFNGTVVLPETNIFLGVDIPEPGITIHQGDIYVIVSDLTDDGEDTPVPVLLEENGGSTDLRSFLLLNRDVPGDPTAVGAYIPISSVAGVVGNVRVRGFGDPAAGGALVTGGGQPVNTDLDPPQNLTALGSSQVTLAYEAAPLPAVNETEPNNSPTTAQAVPFNQVINAVVKTSDPGTDVGGGVFEDWFEFTLAAASPVTVDVVDDGGVDIDIFLYLKSDTSAAIASSAGDCGAHELIDGVELAAGTYVVGIDAFANPGCEATSNTPYQILIVGPGGVRLTAYNIYSGSSPDFVANAASFIGAVGSGTTGVIIQESALGAYYRVSAVYGDEQSAPTDAETGSPCEGGPTVTSVKVKRNGPGTITLNGVAGSVAGITLSINGVGFTKAAKIKKQGTKIQQKGPLANGQTLAQACPTGCTVVIMTTGGGCSTAAIPAP